jgi:hypothetical protein
MLITGPTVEVFRTDVLHESEAKTIIDFLAVILPDCKINFDLQDCDKILRIEGQNISVPLITQWITTKGYLCEPLI